MQSASFLRSIILSSVACPAVQYYFTLSHKRHDFRKEKERKKERKLLNIKCATIFFTPFVSNISHSERRTERDMIKNAYCFFLDIHVSLNRNIIPNYNQQDATFLSLFIFTDALHVSGGSSAHHQEHITVHTAVHT
jgi:hypothetical protein